MIFPGQTKEEHVTIRTAQKIFGNVCKEA